MPATPTGTAGSPRPTRVPRSSPPRSTRRSMKVRAGRPSSRRFTIRGRPSRRSCRLPGVSDGSSVELAEDGEMRPSSPMNSSATKRRLARRSRPVFSRRLASAGGARLKLHQDTGGDAPEGGVEQQQALVDREAQRLVGLLQPPFALAPQLPVAHGRTRQARRSRSAAPHSPRTAGVAVARTCSAAVPELASPGWLVCRMKGRPAAFAPRLRKILRDGRRP